MIDDADPASWKRDIFVLFCAILVFFSIGLAARPYLTPSEARYIELPHQMLITHDWLTPRIDGVPYFEKPPLFYWIQASVMQFFGTGEFAGRIATAVMSTLICLITYATARMFYGRLAGMLAAGALATCALGYALSRVAMVDIPVSLFLTACFACFLTAQNMENRRWYYGMYAAAALAVMSKGLIGIVIPGLVIGTWIILTRRWWTLFEARLISGLLIVLAIAAPWHWLMTRAHPGFFDFYFINEHFTRYLTDSHKRVQPWWFFIAITLAGLLPWTGLLFPTLRQVRLKEPATLFLLIWIALPFLFFSASHSKLAPYIFPVFPPLSMLLGRYLAEAWQGRHIIALRGNAWLVLTLFTIALAVFLFVPLPLDDQNKLAFASLPKSLLVPTGLTLAALAYLLLGRRPAPELITGLAIFALIVDMTANRIVADIDHATVKPLAAQLAPRLHANDDVVAYASYFQDLPVYLDRNVAVAGYTGELDFGVTHYPQTHRWMISDEEFWQRCAADTHNVYVFMKKTTFDTLPPHPDCPLRVIGEYGKTVMLERNFP
ncbi:MAG: glycosyltransferase family 39 protein [Pseudomonadota bacterium]|nr:glycosyltransferase family 39 protein [Pseudomonadota bacterium]